MTLAEGKIGGSYKVEKMDLSPAVHMRLQSLGMTRGTDILILNRKRRGSVIFKIRGTRLAVGKQLAERIMLQ